MPSYGRCQIEYVYMLMFLFVITETNCKSHKYDEPRHALINGGRGIDIYTNTSQNPEDPYIFTDVAVYEHQGKYPDPLLKYGNIIVRKMTAEKIASGENLVQMRENKTKERTVRASVSSPNLSEVSYTKKWRSMDSDTGSVTCKESEEAWSLTPQLVALVAVLCASVVCATVTSVALVYARRKRRCRRCQAAADAAAAAAAVGRPGARSRTRHAPERKRHWVRDPTPYPSLEPMDSLDAAGDAAAVRAALSDTFSDMLMSSSSASSTTPSELNMVGEELPAVHTAPPSYDNVVRLPASFNFRPQFKSRTHGPTA